MWWGRYLMSLHTALVIRIFWGWELKKAQFPRIARTFDPFKMHIKIRFILIDDTVTLSLMILQGICKNLALFLVDFTVARGRLDTNLLHCVRHPFEDDGLLSRCQPWRHNRKTALSASFQTVPAAFVKIRFKMNLCLFRHSPLLVPPRGRFSALSRLIRSRAVDIGILLFLASSNQLVQPKLNASFTVISYNRKRPILCLARFYTTCLPY